jgi:peptidoglycan/LPS O-acetylase OafA/YrhL
VNVVSIVCVVLAVPLAWMLFELIRVEMNGRKRDRMVQKLLDDAERKKRYIWKD